MAKQIVFDGLSSDFHLQHCTSLSVTDTGGVLEYVLGLEDRTNF